MVARGHIVVEGAVVEGILGDTGIGITIVNIIPISRVRQFGFVVIFRQLGFIILPSTVLKKHLWQ